MCDEDREALIERAHDALRRADATMRSPRPFVGAADEAITRIRDAKEHNNPKEPKLMGHSTDYITKTAAREAQDRVEAAMSIVVARQRDALEQRSATLFDLVAELDTRCSTIESRIARLEAAMNIAPTTDDVTH
jgi:hypothetical protein